MTNKVLKMQMFLVLTLTALVAGNAWAIENSDGDNCPLIVTGDESPAKVGNVPAAVTQGAGKKAISAEKTDPNPIHSP